MTEKELLEKAAKATNRKRHPIIADAWSGDGFELMRDASMSIRAPTVWSPITDDGDALRLAVKLKFSVTVFDDAVGIGCKQREDARYAEFPIEGCEYAATRLAITRAAAAMAEKQPTNTRRKHDE